MSAEQNIFGRLAAHMRALTTRLEDLQTSVFQSPPKTMEELNRRLGAWEELQNEIKDLKTVFGGTEDEDKP